MLEKGELVSILSSLFLIAKRLPIFPVVMGTTKMGNIDKNKIMILRFLFSPLVSRSFS
jgi:hypothetical protein